MISPQIHPFEEININHQQFLLQLSSPILKSYFAVNKTDTLLVLTENYIFLTQGNPSHLPTHICKLTFDLKFEVIYQPFITQGVLGIPIAIKLQNQNTNLHITFQASNPSIAEIWSSELEKKINQRNFHKLFRAKKKIGKGAFATVYLAERLRDHKMVAVKAFSKEKQYSGEKGKESLENQIKLMRKLSHSNIIKLEGVYETGNSIYVILEYLEGEQLNELIKSHRKIQENQVKEIIRNILRGLSHLSTHRIIHRDLKPENILFRSKDSWDLVIGDFGLATHADSQKYLFVRCGTPGFVAPQIINIKDMSTKSEPVSDIFSAGIIFHHLLFGCSVFQGKKYNEILSQNRQCSIDFNKDMYKFIKKSVLDLLVKMLEKDPTKRITADQALNHQFFQQTILDEQQELDKILSNSSIARKPSEALTNITNSHSNSHSCIKNKKVNYSTHQNSGSAQGYYENMEP